MPYALGGQLSLSCRVSFALLGQAPPTPLLLTAYSKPGRFARRLGRMPYALLLAGSAYAPTAES